jgi:hypothetical protein
MLKTFAAIAFAAVVAGFITGVPDFVGPVSATSNPDPIPAATCPHRGWPYRDCLSAATTNVRLITTDRLY